LIAQTVAAPIYLQPTQVAKYTEEAVLPLEDTGRGWSADSASTGAGVGKRQSVMSFFKPADQKFLPMISFPSTNDLAALLFA